MKCGCGVAPPLGAYYPNHSTAPIGAAPTTTQAWLYGIAIGFGVLGLYLMARQQRRGTR